MNHKKIRKVLSLMLVFCLCSTGLFYTTSFASALDETIADIDIEQVISETLASADLEDVSRAVIASVSNYTQMKEALEDDSVDIILVLNDIRFEHNSMKELLEINRDLIFLSSYEVSLYNGTSPDHFTVNSDPDGAPITLQFINVVIASENSLGGILNFSTRELTIEGAVFRHCTGLLAANNFTAKNCTFENCNEITFSGSGFMEITNCTFMNCSSAIVTHSASNVEVIIRDSSFINCGRPSRSALDITASLVTISNCLFDGNKGSDGGAILLRYVPGPPCLIESCTFINNTASGNGGAIYDYYAECEIKSCTFDNNRAANGGAVYAAPALFKLLKVDSNTTFTNNVADTGWFMTDPADIALHEANIQAAQFTEPFAYAYNNYDIGYTKGEQLGKVYVSFYLSESETTPYSVIEANPGDVITLPDNPTMAGYRFLSWVDIDYNFFNASVPVNESINLYAVWIKI